MTNDCRLIMNSNPLTTFFSQHYRRDRKKSHRKNNNNKQEMLCFETHFPKLKFSMLAQSQVYV